MICPHSQVTVGTMVLSEVFEMSHSIANLQSGAVHHFKFGLSCT